MLSGILREQLRSRSIFAKLWTFHDWKTLMYKKMNYCEITEILRQTREHEDNFYTGIQQY